MNLKTVVMVVGAPGRFHISAEQLDTDAGRFVGFWSLLRDARGCLLWFDTEEEAIARIEELEERGLFVWDTNTKTCVCK